MSRKGRSLFMLAVILGQFCSPLVAVAETLDTNDSQPTTQSSTIESSSGDKVGTADTKQTTEEEEAAKNTLTLSDKSQLKISAEKTESEAKLALEGHFKGEDSKKTIEKIQLDPSFKAAKESLKGKVYSVIAENEKEEKKEIGSYTIDDKNQMQLTFTEFKEAIDTDFQLELQGSYTRGPDAYKVLIGEDTYEVKIDEVADKQAESKPVETPKKAAQNLKQSVGPQATNNLNDKLGAGGADLSVTFKDAAGNTVDPEDAMTIDTEINVSLKLDFSKMKDPVKDPLKAGDVYTLKLPDNLTFTASTKNEPLVDTDTGKTYGYYHINQDGTVTVTITDETATKAQVDFSGSFDDDKIKTPGKQTIIFPTDETFPQTEVTIKPKIQDSISKAGRPDKQHNPNQVIWSIDFNKDYTKLNDAVITENLPKQLTYDSIQEIIPITTDMDGKVNENPSPAPTPLIEGTDYEIVNGNVHFLHEIDQPYRIVYITNIGDEYKGTGVKATDLNLTNEAVLTSTSLKDPLPATASVDVSYAGVISKSQDKYDKTKQVYNWTIKYNYGEKVIQPENTIKDQSTNMSMYTPTAGAPEVKVYPVTFDNDGKAVQSKTPLDPSMYDYVKTTNANGDDGFTIKFSDAYFKANPEEENRQTAFNVVYQTQVNKVVADNNKITIKNDYDTEHNNTPPGIPGTPVGQGIIKNPPSFNNQNSMAKWTADINKNQYEMKNAYVLDSSKSAAQGNTGVPKVSDARDGVRGINLRDQSNNYKLVEGTDYDLIFYQAVKQANGSYTKGAVTTTPETTGYGYFEVKFKGDKYSDFNSHFVMSYFTELNIHEGQVNDKYVYDNAMDLTWDSDNPDDPYTSHGENKYTPKEGETRQGTKSGSYDPLSKEITWTIVTNYNNFKTPGISLDDPLQGNQQLVPNSVKIERGYIKNGVFTSSESNSGPVNVYGAEKGTVNGIGSNSDGSSYVHYDEEAAIKNRSVNLVIGQMRGPDDDLSSNDYPNAFPGWGNATENGQRKNVFRIFFKTTLKDQVIGTTSQDNLATIGWNKQTNDLSARVTINYTNESSVKTVNYNEKTGYVNWQIAVNRVQSTLYKVTLDDTPSINQTIVEKSIKVYGGIVTPNPDKPKENGIVTPDYNTVLTPGKDYTYSLTTDAATGQQELKFDFSLLNETGNDDDKGNMTKPYFIEYDSTPDFTAREETVKNNIDMKSDGKEVDIPPVPGTKKVKINTSTGVAYGKKGTIVVTKKGAGATLPGATFELWKHYTKSGAAMPDQLLRTAITDSDGAITFGNLIYTDSDPANPFVYIVRETGSPFGFTLQPDTQVTLTGSAEGVTKPVTIDNALTMQFTKKDGDGNPLAGAAFKLTKTGSSHLDEETTYYPENYKPGGPGMTTAGFTIDLYKLTKGMVAPTNGGYTTWDYLLEEIDVPKDAEGNPLYYWNNTQVRFQVRMAADGKKSVYMRTPDGNVEENPADMTKTIPLEMRNYQGSAIFKKKLDGDKPGTGAEFTAYNANGEATGKVGVADEDGDVRITNLPPGKYTIKETKAPTGYYRSSKTWEVEIPTIADGVTSEPAPIQVKDASDNDLVVTNYQGTARLLKIDKDKQKLTGGQFVLTDKTSWPVGLDGEKLPETAPSSSYIIESAKNGFVEFTGLYPGKTYYVMELLPPDYLGPNSGTRYLPNPNLYKIVMPAENDQNTVDVEDTLPNSDGNGVANPILDLADETDTKNYDPIYNFTANVYFVKQGVPNIANPTEKVGVAESYFILKHREANSTDEFDDGSKYTQPQFGARKGDDGNFYFISTSYAGIEGQVTASNLGTGDYRFVEVKAADGYVLTTKTKDFTIDDDTILKDGDSRSIDIDETGEEPRQPWQTEKLVNYAGAVEIFKNYLDQDGKSQLLAGAEFNIYKKDAKEGDDPVNTSPIVSGPDGKVFYAGLSSGEYYLQEISNPNNEYIVNQTKIHFEIDNTSQTNSWDDSYVARPLTDPLLNVQGKFTMQKNGVGDDAKGLDGATFTLQKADANGDYQDTSVAAASANGGKVELDGLAPGKYRLVETTPAPGYLKNTAPVDFEIPASVPDTDKNTGPGYDEVYVVDEDTPYLNYKGSAKILKTDDSDPGTPLSGAEFAVYDEKTKTVVPGYESIPTGNDGYATATDLAPGDYYFKEVDSPSGYIRNDDYEGHFTIPAEANGEPKVVTTDNNTDQDDLIAINTTGSAVLKKQTKAGDPLPGVTFSVYRWDDSKNQVDGGSVASGLRSDMQGNVTVKGLKPGKYVFQETDTRSDFILNTDYSAVFEIKDFTDKDNPVQVTKDVDGKDLVMINYRGSAQLKKQDANGDPLGGAVFILDKDGSGDIGREFTSDENTGIVTFDDLEPGVYTVKEKTAPDGYIRSENTLEFTIKPETSGEPLPVTVANGATKEMTLANIKGSAQLIKQDAVGNKLAGAHFDVYKVNDDQSETKITATPIESQGDGVIQIDGLAPGNYYFLESAVDGGYLVNTTKVNFKIPDSTDQESVLVTKDVNKADMALKNYKASVELTKNQISNTITGDQTPLENAVFRIYKDGDMNTVVDEQSTKSTGVVRFDNLEAGQKYIIKEFSAPTGFQINDTEFAVTVPTEIDKELVINQSDDGKALQLIDFKGSARMKKTDAEGKDIDKDALADAEFGVFPASNPSGAPLASGLKADDDGYITATGLAPGQYVFKETKAATGYLLNDAPTQVFTIPGIASTADPIEVMQDPSAPTDPTKTVPMTMKNYQGSAQLKKTDADDKILPGAEFQLFADPDDTTPLPNTKVTSDENGLVTFTNLAPGTYTAKETKEADGFIRSDKTFTFTIADHASGEPTMIGNMTIKNVKGKAILKKTDKDQKGLENAAFEVYDKNTQAKVSGDQPILSDSQGNVTTGELPPGDYYFKEVTAPTDYLLNPTTVPFTIPDHTASEETVVVKTNDAGALNLINYKGNSELTKKDEDGEPLAGATFTLYQGGQPVGEPVESDKNGKVSFKELAPGTYTVKETAPADGYQQNTSELTFVIPNETTEPITIKVAVNDGKDMEITNYQGRAELTKQDVGGNVLTGAIFTLFKDGAPYRQNLPVEADGILRVAKLPPGDYYFQETTAAPGYLLNTKPSATFTIAKTANELQTEKLTLTNYKGSVELQKSGLTMVDGKEQTANLAGATFVIKQGDQVIQETTSGADGKVTFTELAPGDYTIAETKAAEGYIRSTNTFDVTVPEEAADKPAAVTKDASKDKAWLKLTNVKGSAILKKTDEAEKALANATFAVYPKGSTTAIQENLLSDSKGQVTAVNLAPGEYYFKETKQPDGYLLNPTEYPFTIPDETADQKTVVVTDDSLTSVNYQGNIELQKNDEYGEALAGAVFTLTSKDDAAKTFEATADKAGKVDFNDLAPGTYLLQETKAAKGYQLNDTELTVVVPAEADAHVSITKDQEGKDLTVVNYQGNAELKKQAVDGTPLAGAEFAVYAADAQGAKDKPIQEGLTSDKDGLVKVKDLAPGTYIFKETKAADGYLLNTQASTSFTINETATTPQTEKLDMINYKGSVQLQKSGLTKVEGKEQTAPLAGATFAIKQGDKVIQEVTSDADGKVTFTELSPGEYTIAETKAADGYIRSTKEFAVTIPETAAGEPKVITTDSKDHDLKLTNVKGFASLLKTDEAKKALADATFAVYPKGSTTATQENLLSDSKGQVTVDNLAPGDYYFKETKQPNGYLLNPTEYPFTIPATTDGEQTVVVKEDSLTAINYRGNIQLQKNDEAGKGLAGATFTLTDQADSSKAVTAKSDKDGKASFKDLAPGTYTLQETEAAKGYQLDDKELTVVIPNEADSSVLITKDADGQDLTVTNYRGNAQWLKQDVDGKGLAGVEFAVYKKDDQGEKDKLVKENLTSDKNGLVKVTGLAPGDYVFKETKAAPGYLKNTTISKVFTIAEKAQADETVTTFADGSEMSMINYQGKVRLDKVGVTDEDGVLKEAKLSDAEFTLTNKADTKDVRDAKSVDGAVTFEGIAPGTYTLAETKAPKGYIRSTKTFEVTIPAEAAGELKVITTDTNGNDLKLKNVKGAASLLKTDEAGKGLAGAAFSLFRKGEVAPIVKDRETDKDGKLKVDNLAPGDYYFQETQAPDGYQLNDKKFEFTITDTTDQEKPVVADAGTVVNYQGQVQLTKETADGQKLAGAEFTMTGENDFKRAATSDKDGSVDFTKLAPGTYTIEETKQPDGYQLNPTKLTVVVPVKATEATIIKTDKDGKDLKVVNYQGQAELQKRSEDDKALAGAEFAVYDATKPDGKAVQENLTSDKDGKVTVTGLAPGTYFFKETKAPEGYLLNTEASASFTIEKEADKVTVVKQDDKGAELKLINYQGSVRLTKSASGSTQKLADAEFRLQTKEGQIIKFGLVTDKNGELTVDGLAPGEYSFVETKAPTGYQLDTTPVTFTISDKAAGKPELVEVSKKNTVTPGGFIPKTGSTQNIWIGIAGLGLVGGSGFAFWKRKKREE